MDLGPGSYLTRHVLIFRDPEKTQIESGMRLAYDRASLDHRHLTEMITAGKKDIEFVELKAHQTIKAIHTGQIDAGVWNLDEIIESGYDDLNVVPIQQFADVSKFSTAVIVITRGDGDMAQLLRQYVQPERVCSIQLAVREGRLPADY